MPSPEFNPSNLEDLQKIRQIDDMWWRVGFDSSGDTASDQAGENTFRRSMEVLEDEDIEPQSEQQTPVATESAQTDYPGVVVEQMRIGNIDVTAVICSHTPENAAEIAEQLKDCEVLAFENVGFRDDNERREHEQLYTLLTSSQVDPDALDRVFVELGRGFMAEVLKPLRGTDKRIVLLDVNQDHPQYHLVQSAEQARFRHVDAVVDLATLEEADAALNDVVRLSAAVWPARDQVQSDQLKALINKLDNAQPGSRVGVMVGITHHESIASLNTLTGLTSSTMERLERSKSLYDRAIMAATHNSPSAESLRARALLSAYLMVHVFDPEQQRHSDELASKLDEPRLREVLSGLSVCLSDPSAVPPRKANNVKYFLKAVVDLLAE